jgi:hypothetical protein
MTLNSSGPISLGGATAGQSVNLELGFSATATIAMNTTAVRTLAGFPTAGSQYSLSNFYGKSNTVTISYTFTTSTQNAALAMSAISGYVAGASIITITVNAGIYLWASTTGNYGLNLTGGATGDTVTLVNNGYIMGCGGAGPTGFATANVGGPALNVGIAVNITVDNTNGSAYIGGGGGSGGGGYPQTNAGGGGGAGGGAGGATCGTSGGSGGSIGGSGGNGSSTYCGCCGTTRYGAGGGGRIFPGTGGGNHLGGSAGGGGGSNTGTGGTGGSSNNAGGNGSGSGYGGGGGGWGATGGLGAGNPGFNNGAAGGKAVNLNGKTITWTSGNTTRVYGAVS